MYDYFYKLIYSYDPPVRSHHNKVLYYLKKIEDGELTFYQASYEIGTLLKSMYVDPIVEDKEKEKEKGRNIKPISWDDFKKLKS